MANHGDCSADGVVTGPGLHVITFLRLLPCSSLDVSRVSGASREIAVLCVGASQKDKKRDKKGRGIREQSGGERKS